MSQIRYLIESLKKTLGEGTEFDPAEWAESLTDMLLDKLAAEVNGTISTATEQAHDKGEVFHEDAKIRAYIVDRVKKELAGKL